VVVIVVVVVVVGDVSGDVDECIRCSRREMQS
jgi:hypothetical protein